MRVTRKQILDTINLREDELDLVEKYALYEGATRILLQGLNLKDALTSIRIVWGAVHTEAEKRRRALREMKK